MIARNKEKEINFKTERELVDGLLAGRNDAQTEFYNQFKGLFFYCLRKTLCDVSMNLDFEEDLINDCFIYLLEDNARRLANFRGEKEGCLAYYLGKMIIRYFIRFKNKYQNKFFDEFKEEIGGSPSSENEDGDITTTVGDSCDDSMAEAIKREEAWNYLERIMANMHNQRYAEALRIYYACGYDDEKAAIEMNINIDNWYMLKKRAIKQLQDTHKKNKVLWQNIISQMS